MDRNITPIILAGGFGERTKDVLQDTPKLLITTFDGKSILDHMTQELEKSGFEKIIIATNARFYEQIQSAVQSSNLDITVINNGRDDPDKRLGALGDLLFAIEKAEIDPESDILVLPSDTAFWRSFSISDFLAFAQKHPGDFVTVVSDTGDKEKIRENLGCVIFGENGEIADFEEKPQEPKSTLTIVAIYIFRPNHIRLLKEFRDMGGNLNSPSNIIPFLKEKGVKIFGFFPEGKVVDANNPEEIKEAKNY